MTITELERRLEAVRLYALSDLCVRSCVARRAGEACRPSEVEGGVLLVERCVSCVREFARLRERIESFAGR